MVVNGLPLPNDLLALIAMGRWKRPADQSGIDRLFPDHGGFCPYSPAAMQFESEAYPPEAAVRRLGLTMWLGKPDPDNPPGDLDPKQAVLIADLGLGCDSPIALDYRVSIERPRVLYLRWPPNPHGIKPEEENHWRQANRWVEVAPDIMAFAELAGF